LFSGEAGMLGTDHSDARADHAKHKHYKCRDNAANQPFVSPSKLAEL